MQKYYMQTSNNRYRLKYFSKQFQYMKNKVSFYLKLSNKNLGLRSDKETSLSPPMRVEYLLILY